MENKKTGKDNLIKMTVNKLRNIFFRIKTREKSIIAKKVSGRRYSTTRYSMYNSIEKYIKRYKISGKILLISEGKELSIRRMFPNNSVFLSTNYPEVDVMDLSSFDKQSLDVVVTDQVLEHVPDPFKANQEIYRILKPYGFVINTSCSFNPIHSDLDYYRFTKNGFREIHKMFKNIIVAESWGNREVIGKFVLEDYKSFNVMNNLEDYELAIKNELTWPWVVWCIAQKL